MTHRFPGGLCRGTQTWDGALRPQTAAAPCRPRPQRARSRDPGVPASPPSLPSLDGQVRPTLPLSALGGEQTPERSL